MVGQLWRRGRTRERPALTSAWTEFRGQLARRAGRLRVLTYAELLDAGLSRKAVRHRVDQGRLQEWCTGVYLVGPAPAHPLSQAQAAIKSCTGSAWISHAWTHYVLGYGPVPPLPVDVTVTSGSRRGPPGQGVRPRPGGPPPRPARQGLRAPQRAARGTRHHVATRHSDAHGRPGAARRCDDE